ncbi:MAG: hypothetical protein R3E48_16030 [Burkholderiaceae bacterium]
MPSSCQAVPGHEVRTRAARLARVLAAASIVAVVAGCASTAPSASGPAETRSKLTSEEIRQMKPEIGAHSKCLVTRAVAYSGGTSDVKLIVETARARCRSALVPVLSKLRGYGLTRDARARYLRMIEGASTSMLTERILLARQRARQNSNVGKTRPAPASTL